MNRILPLFTLFLMLSAPPIRAQQVQVIHLDEFKQLLAPTNDTVYVLNFWATWCKPCVAELPGFEAVNAEFASEKVKVVLVSLDFAEEMNSRLIPFVKKRKLQSRLLLLDEPDANKWINWVSGEWSGAIPATLIVRGDTQARVFHEGEMTQEQLTTIIQQLINQKL